MPQHSKVRTRERHARLRWHATAHALLLSAAVSCGGDAGTASSDAMAATAATAGVPAATSSNGTLPGAVAGRAASAPVGTPVQPTSAGSPAPAAAVAGTGAPIGMPGVVSMPAASGAAGAAASAPHDHAAAGSGSMSAAQMHCLYEHNVDPRDEMLTNEPLMHTSGSQKDLLVPQIVLDWMAEREFESAHDAWHLVRKWDQSCLKSNATASSCRAAQRLLDQGLERAPIQQGAPGDGLAFMVMHRHMIHMLKESFPKHTALFDGFKKVPRTKDDPENPTPWRNISWTSDNIKGFDILENIEKNLDMFPTEDALGNYIENTYVWTPERPMSPTNKAGSGLHGALHSQWSVSGSPGNLIDQAIDVRNYSFWKLHGWIDDVWQRYRVAKGLKDDDPKYLQDLHDQCMEMYYLKKSNRKLPMTGTPGAAGSGAPSPTMETGYFATQVRPFLDSTCGGCHSAIGPSAGLTLGGKGISSKEVISGLVGQKSTNGQYNLIEPRDPLRSWVYVKASGDVATIACTGNCERQTMPPSGAGLTAPQLDALKQWIMNGATEQ